MKSAIIFLTMAGFCLSGCGTGSGKNPAKNVGDAFAEPREQMVAEQLIGAGRNITNRQVLQAMRTIPRHEFVPDIQKPHAYEDHPLPIGYGQTISQPFIVAFMTEKLDPQPTDRILEVGTGSGYQAAILATLAKEVYSIEIVEPLGKQADLTLKRLHLENVKVKVGDGYEGWPEYAPFDAIIVTCAPEKIPQPLIDQLKEGGKMIIPTGVAFHQELCLLEKHGRDVRRKNVLPVRFVPMTGKAADEPTPPEP
jgi:protein-L-isoaspartate(D-aspartate) O-methyltransferase